MANKMIGIDGKPLPPPQNGPDPFAKWLYHKKHEPRLFHNEEKADTAMKEGWVAKPWHVDNPPEEPEENPDDKLTKAELVEKYDLDMDPEKVKRDDILKAIEELKADDDTA